MYAIRSTTRGSGKSLLVDVISTIGSQHTAARFAHTDDENEDRKRLLAVALAGDPVLCIDNVLKPLGSQALDMVLTAESIKDRILGESRTVEAPWNAVVFATGGGAVTIGQVVNRVAQGAELIIRDGQIPANLEQLPGRPAETELDQTAKKRKRQLRQVVDLAQHEARLLNKMIRAARGLDSLKLTQNLVDISQRRVHISRLRVHIS